jgi:hypothetical protein
MGGDVVKGTYMRVTNILGQGAIPLIRYKGLGSAIESVYAKMLDRFQAPLACAQSQNQACTATAWAA